MNNAMMCMGVHTSLQHTDLSQATLISSATLIPLSYVTSIFIDLWTLFCSPQWSPIPGIVSLLIFSHTGLAKYQRKGLGYSQASLSCFHTDWTAYPNLDTV